MIFRFRAPVGATLAAAAVALGGAGCNDEGYTWIGRVHNGNSGMFTDAVGAVTVRDGEVRAYTCGGATTFSTLTRWFDGRVGGSASIEASSDDGWSMYGYVDDAFAWAELSSTGTGAFFSIEGARAYDDLSGLYAVEDSGCLTGVVVIAGEGTTPRLQGTWCDDAGNFAQVTPVDPIVRSAQGIQVQVTTPDGTVKELYVTKEAAR